jgi:penicillin-binding protein 1A
VVAGGSSISQQTAKLLFDRRERTFSRKLTEMVNAAKLEKSFSKRQILELYLNRIYLGGGAYGVDTAARTYFGVSARHVNLAQAAMLAALTRAPSVFSPRRDLAAAQDRAARVLAAMADMGAIRADQASEAAAHPATIIARPVDSHSYFLDAAAEEARKLAGDAGPGALIVHTTLKSELQASAEHIASDAVSRMGRKLDFSQVAIVTMKPDGAVAAMVGGVSYDRSVFNRVLQAHRQPGSAFKPFVYLAALEAGISPWDRRDDRSVDIAGYHPTNYNDTHYGSLRLTDALARSVNTITVNLAQEVGITRVAAVAKRAGITSPLQSYASLALGANEVTPLELTAAYGTFARGEPLKPYLVSRIETADGRLVYAHENVSIQPVIADSVRRDLTAMLFNVVMSGTGTGARLPGREAAGKTGTTQDYRDAWFVGFTADYIASVWIGNDDNRPMRKVTGGLVPALLWKEVMSVAESGLPAVALDRSPEPANVDEDFAAAQVAYVDEVRDINSAAPQVPMDGKGDFLAGGSGVSPGPAPAERVARNDGGTLPAPSYEQRVPMTDAPLRQAEPPRETAQNPPEAQGPSYYPRPPEALDAYPQRVPQLYYAPRPERADPPRQEPPQGPLYDRPWQPVRPMPYQTYLDPPPREPPPGYYPVPRSYYPPPSYEDPRDR